MQLKEVKSMYYNCHYKIAACCLFGILGIICTIIQFIIISCLLITIYNLIFKRISIEPMHHPDGDYHWAITRNGKTIKWL